MSWSSCVPWHVTGHRAENMGDSSTPLGCHMRPRGTEKPRWGCFCLLPGPYPSPQKAGIETLGCGPCLEAGKEGARRGRSGTQGSLGGCGCEGPPTVWVLITLASHLGGHLLSYVHPDPEAAWAPAGSPPLTQAGEAETWLLGTWRWAGAGAGAAPNPPGPESDSPLPALLPELQGPASSTEPPPHCHRRTLGNGLAALASVFIFCREGEQC